MAIHVTLPVILQFNRFCDKCQSKGTRSKRKWFDTLAHPFLRFSTDIFIITIYKRLWSYSLAIYHSIRHRKSSLGRYWRVKIALPCEKKIHLDKIKLKRQSNIRVMKLPQRTKELWHDAKKTTVKPANVKRYRGRTVGVIFLVQMTWSQFGN